MKRNTFGEIPLSPINRQAASMLAAVDNDDLKKTDYYLGLMDESEEIARSIASMESQLRQVRDAQSEWRRQCEYNLSIARSRSKQIITAINMVRSICNSIVKDRSKLKREELRLAMVAKQNENAENARMAKMKKKSLAAEQATARMAKAQEEKTKRVAMDSAIQAAAGKHFRRMVMDKIGESETIDMLQLSLRLATSEIS